MERRDFTVQPFTLDNSKLSKHDQQWQYQPGLQPNGKWEKVCLIWEWESRNKDLPAWCFYGKFHISPWESCFLAKKYLRIATQNNFWCKLQDHMFVSLIRVKKKKAYYNLITVSMASWNWNIKLSDTIPVLLLPGKSPSEMVLSTACASWEATLLPHLASVNYGALK